jgi:hypothetical protein
LDEHVRVVKDGSYCSHSCTFSRSVRTNPFPWGTTVATI